MAGRAHRGNGSNVPYRVRSARWRTVIGGLVVALAACTSSGQQEPAQSSVAVAALLADALKACGAPLAPHGVFDQGAIVAAGWRETKRTTRFEATDQVHAAGTIPELRAGEYEATEWSIAGRTGTLSVIRTDTLTPRLIADRCSINARLDSRDGLASLVAALSSHLGRRVDRAGEMPRGGDFLTPRFDAAPYGYYWQWPQHDVYLVVHDGVSVRLEINAMPDRAGLDRYSPDLPEARIPGSRGQTS